MGPAVERDPWDHTQTPPVAPHQPWGAVLVPAPGHSTAHPVLLSLPTAPAPCKQPGRAGPCLVGQSGPQGLRRSAGLRDRASVVLRAREGQREQSPPAWGQSQPSAALCSPLPTGPAPGRGRAGGTRRYLLAMAPGTDVLLHSLTQAGQPLSGPTALFLTRLHAKLPALLWGTQRRCWYRAGQRGDREPPARPRPSTTRGPRATRLPQAVHNTGTESHPPAPGRPHKKPKGQHPARRRWHTAPGRAG